MSDPTEMGDQAIDWVAAAISRYRYKPRYQWPTMSEKERDWLRGEARVAIEAVRETALYTLWQIPPGTRTVCCGATASGTLTEGGDVEQAPGESLSGPTAESGDAQPTPVSGPISNKGER